MAIFNVRSLFLLIAFSLAQTPSFADDLADSLTYLFKASRTEEGFGAKPEAELIPHLHKLFEEMGTDLRADDSFLKLYPHIYRLQVKHGKKDTPFWGQNASKIFPLFRVSDLRRFAFQLGKKRAAVQWHTSYRSFLLSKAYEEILAHKKLSQETDSIFQELRATAIPNRQAVFKAYLTQALARLNAQKESVEKKGIDFADPDIQIMVLALEAEDPIAFHLVEEWFTPFAKTLKKNRLWRQLLVRKLDIPFYFDEECLEKVITDPECIFSAILEEKPQDVSSLQGLKLPKGALDLIKKIDIYKRFEIFATRPEVNVTTEKYVPELFSTTYMSLVLSGAELPVNYELYVFLTQLEIDVVEPWTIFMNRSAEVRKVIARLPKEVMAFFPTVLACSRSIDAVIAQRDKILKKICDQSSTQTEDQKRMSKVIFMGSVLDTCLLLAIEQKPTDDDYKKIKELSAEQDAVFAENLSLICKRLGSNTPLKLDGYLKLYFYAVSRRHPQSCIQFLTNDELQELVGKEVYERTEKPSNLSNLFQFIKHPRELMSFIKVATDTLENGFGDAPDQDMNLMCQASILIHAASLMYQVSTQNHLSARDQELCLALEVSYTDKYVDKIFDLTDRPKDQVNPKALLVYTEHFPLSSSGIRRQEGMHPFLHLLKYSDPDALGMYLRCRAMVEGRYGYGEDTDIFRRIDRVGEEMLKLVTRDKIPTAIQVLADKLLDKLNKATERTRQMMGVAPMTVQSGKTFSSTANGYVVDQCFKVVDRLNAVPDSPEKWISEDALFIYSMLPYDIRVAWDYFLINYQVIKARMGSIRAFDPRWKGHGNSVRGYFTDRDRVATKFKNDILSYFNHFTELQPHQKLTFARLCTAYMRFMSEDYPEGIPLITQRMKDIIYFGIQNWGLLFSTKESTATVRADFAAYLTDTDKNVAEWKPTCDLGHALKLVCAYPADTVHVTHDQVVACLKGAQIKDPLVSECIKSYDQRTVPYDPQVAWDPVPGDDIFRTKLFPSRLQRLYKMPEPQLRELRLKAIKGYGVLKQGLRTLGDEAWHLSSLEPFYEALVGHDLYAYWVFLDNYRHLKRYVDTIDLGNTDFCTYGPAVLTIMEPLTTDRMAEVLIEAFERELPNLHEQVVLHMRLRIARLYLTRFTILADYLSLVSTTLEPKGVEIDYRLPDALAKEDASSITNDNIHIRHFNCYLQHMAILFDLAEKGYADALEYVQSIMGYEKDSKQSFQTFMQRKELPVRETGKLYLALTKIGGLLGQQKDVAQGVRILKQLRESRSQTGAVADVCYVYLTDIKSRQGDKVIKEMIRLNGPVKTFMDQFKQPEGVDKKASKKK